MHGNPSGALSGRFEADNFVVFLVLTPDFVSVLAEFLVVFAEFC
jgi:hypothetical protein